MSAWETKTPEVLVRCKKICEQLNEVVALIIERDAKKVERLAEMMRISNGELGPKKSS